MAHRRRHGPPALKDQIHYGTDDQRSSTSLPDMSESDTFDYLVRQMQALSHRVAAEVRENEELKAENERLRVQKAVPLERVAFNGAVKSTPRFGAVDRTLARFRYTLDIR